MLFFLRLLCLLFFCQFTPALFAQTPPEFREGLAISRVAQGGRRPFSPDAIAAQMTRGTFGFPQLGDKVTVADGQTKSWEHVEADAQGSFDLKSFAGGYLYLTAEAPVARIAILEATGQAMVYVNGEPRAVAAYGSGRLKGDGADAPIQMPVLLNAGRNTFLFAGGRNSIAARLSYPKKPLFFQAQESTLPDIRVGETGEMWASSVVANATEKTTSRLTISAVIEAGGKSRTVQTTIPPIAPLTVRKVAFRIAAPPGLTTGEPELQLALVKDNVVQDTSSLSLRIRKPEETFKRTFISQIDGSVQYFGVRPALKPASTNGLIISLHGAGVEAIGQADAYGPKDDITIVAPTNRRPFGFDWEDIGRRDALEVVDIARREIQHDPARVALTGHSMGGHGTWALGSLFPDQFAAIAPSAGWVSFATYAGGVSAPVTISASPETLEQTLLRGANLHDTDQRVRNLLNFPIFILHGDADDNVPVTEARHMRQSLLEQGHKRVAYHEESGAGHWWDASPAPGADAVDYAPMMMLLSNSRIAPPQERYEASLTTANPAVSSRNGWLTVVQQESSLHFSSAQFVIDGIDHILRGSSRNVRRLRIDSSLLPTVTNKRMVEIDGQVIPVSAKGYWDFQKKDKIWKSSGPVPSSEKNTARGGSFKEVFANRIALVYGTKGTPEENRWMLARARFDGEIFLYRGNGSPDILSDSEYLAQRSSGSRNVLVYGNKDANAAWAALLSDSPIQMTRGRISGIAMEGKSDNLAIAFVRPVRNSDTVLVAAVGGTDIVGMRATDRLPYFTSGAAFPDWVVFDARAVEQGASAVLKAGYFDPEWKLPGEKRP